MLIHFINIQSSGTDVQQAEEEAERKQWLKTRAVMAFMGGNKETISSNPIPEEISADI